MRTASSFDSGAASRRLAQDEADWSAKAVFTIFCASSFVLILSEATSSSSESKDEDAAPPASSEA